MKDMGSCATAKRTVGMPLRLTFMTLLAKYLKHAVKMSPRALNKKVSEVNSQEINRVLCQFTLNTP